MHSPPVEIEPSEKVLKGDEIAMAACTAEARNTVASRPGIVMNSEIVSHSDEFGYIYRYDVVGSIESRGETINIHNVMIVWSKDCESIQFASHSMFKLPTENS